VRLIHQCLGNVTIDTRHVDIETSPQRIGAVSKDQVHFGVDSQIIGKNNLHLASRNLDRTFETGRLTGGEQLLRISAGARTARR
jgi:hypothetical protein